jgi:Carbohydrate-binding family 9
MASAMKGLCVRVAACLLVALLCLTPAMSTAQPQTQRPELHVRATEDFTVTGHGDNPAWNAVPDWTPLNVRKDVKDAFATRFKLLYSSKGLYVLMDAADKKLTANFQEDFADLWTQDVFEVFLWPDERDPIYFEYEISPLGKELAILVPNLDNKFLGWRPWHYDTERQIRKAATVTGGKQESGAAIEGWRAEIFIPYALLRPLRNVPPAKGSRWRANFYRMDYDTGSVIQWDWARVGPSFHEFNGFGTIIFD